VALREPRVTLKEPTLELREPSAARKDPTLALREPRAALKDPTAAGIEPTLALGVSRVGLLSRAIKTDRGSMMTLNECGGHDWRTETSHE
jgi:hypothetical protein